MHISQHPRCSAVCVCLTVAIVDLGVRDGPRLGPEVDIRREQLFTAGIISVGSQAKCWPVLARRARIEITVQPSGMARPRPRRARIRAHADG